MKFAVACLLGLTSAFRLNAEPVAWDKDTLPECPTDKKRTVMDDGKTHVAKYPFVGSTCRLQVVEEGITLIQLGDAAPAEIAAPAAPAEISAPVAPAAPAEIAASAAPATAPVAPGAPAEIAGSVAPITAGGAPVAPVKAAGIPAPVATPKNKAAATAVKIEEASAALVNKATALNKSTKVADAPPAKSTPKEPAAQEDKKPDPVLKQVVAPVAKPEPVVSETASTEAVSASAAPVAPVEPVELKSTVQEDLNTKQPDAAPVSAQDAR